MFMEQNNVLIVHARKIIANNLQYKYMTVFLQLRKQYLAIVQSINRGSIEKMGKIITFCLTGRQVDSQLLPQ